MEAAIIELGIYAVVCVIGTFITIVLPVAYILWERNKKKGTSKGRERLGAELGLGSVDADGGQDRLGGQRGANRWLVGWEVRKIAGGPPSFVTFFECYAPNLIAVEIRHKLPGKPSAMSGQFGGPTPMGLDAFDAKFEAAGDTASLTSEAMTALNDLLKEGDDVYVMPDRVVLLYKGDHQTVEDLRGRIDRVERVAALLTR